MRIPPVLTLIALLPLGGPLGAQEQPPPPRERAEEFERQAREAATDQERARLWFFSVAEWHEEGARAVLAMDQSRFEHAVEQGDSALLPALTWRSRACRAGHLEMHESVVSMLAYVLGQWHGQGGLLGNQAVLADRLLDGADRARRNGESCFP